MRCDVAIVGAGPAGLTAAVEVARPGLSVVVLDEYYRPGGRLLGQIYEDRRKPAGARLWDGRAVAEDLEARARAAGVTILAGRTVWDVDAGWKLHVAPGPETEIDARAVIVATGALERAIPVPGWTLPGVMTIGAAQVLTNVHAVAPGRRVLVVGMDPLALSITGEMVAAGVNVVGVVLPRPGPLSGDLAVPARAIARLSQASALAPSVALRVGGRVFGGRLSVVAAALAKVDVLRVWGVPLHLRTALVEIVGSEEVEAARVAAVDARGRTEPGDRLIPVDAVCLSGGLSPLSDLVRLAGCPTATVPELGGPVPLHGPSLETALPGLFVAGNVVGIEGAAVAAAQGRVAALGVLRFLGDAHSASDAERTIADARDAVTTARRSLAFRFLPNVEAGHRRVEALWNGALPTEARDARAGDVGPPDLILCRCEEVSLGSVLAALDDGATAIAGVKKRTRACMGRCQGRVCEDAVERVAAARGGAEILRHRARMPVRPVRLADL